MEKLTIAKKFELVKAELLNANADNELVRFIEDEKAKVDRKNANRKPTKVQQENVGLYTAIYNYLADGGRKMAIKDMIKEIPECAGLTTSKVSGVLRPYKEKTIGRTEEKGVALFYALGNAEVEVEGE